MLMGNRVFHPEKQELLQKFPAAPLTTETHANLQTITSRFVKYDSLFQYSYKYSLLQDKINNGEIINGKKLGSNQATFRLIQS